MERKRITELCPWLLPLRKRQRKLFFYAAMKRDGRRYSRELQAERLPVRLFESRCPMINDSTGFDLKYQENKVYNLKLAAEKLDGLVIRPGETFSFWQAIRDADRERPYKEGLAEINGRLTTEYGGGLCMLSNLIFWVMLHSPLSIAERHGHREKDFPEPPSDALYGVDATVAEGWLDLKLENRSELSFQLEIGFEGGFITGAILSSLDLGQRYSLENGPVEYLRRGREIYERAPVIRLCRTEGAAPEREELYTNLCRIGYTLPEGTEIREEESDG